MNDVVVPLWMWLVFGTTVLALIAIDLLAHRGEGVDSRRRALMWSVAWIGVAVLFNVGVWAVLGVEPAEEFLAVYLLEKSLSVDNLFVFLLLFGGLGIPHAQQRRVLTWGIFGALVTRALCIGLGVAALQRWHGLVYALGALLVVTAVKMLVTKPATHATGGRTVAFLRRHLPLTNRLHGSRFMVREGGRWLATPLLVALLAVEVTDVVFALDSVPAGFAVTEAPFVIYSANVFALLGLRSLYVVLADALGKLHYLRYGLAAVLGLAGVKMIASHWIRVPPLVAVGAIALCLGLAVLASLMRVRRPAPARGGDRGGARVIAERELPAPEGPRL
jgi:tellurite resistance protein TerC